MNANAFREIISGQRQGVTARLARSGLGALSAGYRFGVGLRNTVFDLGCRRVHRAAVPVVSIGNVTTGGTGKTPFVALVTTWFLQKGVRPALLSRGYRSLPGAVNDEKLLLDRLCPRVPHFQNPDRVRSADAAVQQGAELLILDDGFQHRRLARDVDMVLIDALNPWGYGRLLPRGLLREPLSSLRRADLIVLTRADQCTEQVRQTIRSRLAEVRCCEECVEIAFPAKGLRNSSGGTCEFSAFSARPIVAFCGIGNPDGFRRTLEQAGLQPGQFQPFPDHHHYTPVELEELAQLARQIGAAALVATAKDLVKIDRNALGGCPLWAVEIETEIRAGGELLEQQLQRVLSAAREPAHGPAGRTGLK